MAQIKIIAIPPGEAPEWVRREWVDLVLPIAEKIPKIAVLSGVLGGKIEDFEGGYPVKTETAIQLLSEKNARAAQWWNDNVFPKRMPLLIFQFSVCKLLES
jgi:hypothetical protein